MFECAKSDRTIRTAFWGELFSQIVQYKAVQTHTKCEGRSISKKADIWM